jgi:5-methylcytosine-specific restriction endonuclease McrA
MTMATTKKTAAKKTSKTAAKKSAKKLPASKRSHNAGTAKGYYGSRWIRTDLRLAINARDGFHCVYCGCSANLSLDHVTPRELGGDNKPSNLVTACSACNSAKKDLPVAEFVASLGARGEGLADRVREALDSAVDRKLGKALEALRPKAPARGAKFAPPVTATMFALVKSWAKSALEAAPF